MIWKSMPLSTPARRLTLLAHQLFLYWPLKNQPVCIWILTPETYLPKGNWVQHQVSHCLNRGAIGPRWIPVVFRASPTNPVDPPSDIMFSVDLSCSMDDDAAALGDNFSTFIGELSNYSNDWQIMVVNDDDGCSNSGILRPSTSNYQSIFSNAVQSCGNCGWLGEPMLTEALLTVSSRGVENTDSGECNAGFMRPNALLHLVLVSDEPEQSSAQWDSYVNQVIAKKGNAANVRISAIAGDYPGGCSSSNNSAEAGTGYWEAANATGGVFLSICDAWADPANLQMLAEASVIVNSYPLDNQAVGSTVQVFVNGVGPATDGNGNVVWHYDESTNSVIFDSDAPKKAIPSASLMRLQRLAIKRTILEGQLRRKWDVVPSNSFCLRILSYCVCAPDL